MSGRIKWADSSAMKDAVNGYINDVRMIRIWPNGERYMMAYPEGLRRAHIEVDSLDEGKERAEELIASFLDRIGAEFFSEEEEAMIRLLIAAREEGLGIGEASEAEQEEFWQALKARAAKRYVQGASEASGPLADLAPESDSP